MKHPGWEQDRGLAFFPAVHKVYIPPVEYRQALIRLGKNLPDMTLLELSKRTRRPINWLLNNLLSSTEELEQDQENES